MTLKKIRVSVIFLAISIFAIIVFQIYWITSLYRVKESIFSAAVIEALQSSVNKIQSGRVIKIMSSISHSSKDKSEFNFDTLITSQSKVIISTNDSIKLTALTQIDDGKDSVCKKVKKIVISNSKHTNKDSSQNIYVQNIVKQVVSEIEMFGDSSNYSHFSVSDIDSVISSELKEKGLVIPFHFAIINKNDSLVKNLQSKGFSNDMINSGIIIKLNPQNLLIPSDRLVVFFPGKTGYLLKSLWISLFLSLILSIFIIVTFLFTFRNIIKQKKLSDIKNDFINNLTHELKTPIATINLASDSLLNEKVLHSPNQVEFYAKAIKNENARINQHVEQVLQLSLVENNAFSMDFNEIDLVVLIQSIVERFKLIVEKQQGIIRFNYNEKQTYIADVDYKHFGNMISNLIDNACKYTSQPPDISISLDKTSESITLSVKDKGIGIASEYKTKVFEKFFRVPTGNLHEVKGFGLGLSYVKAIALAHKMKIYVENNDDKGSCFTLIIPLNQK